MEDTILLSLFQKVLDYPNPNTNPWRLTSVCPDDKESIKLLTEETAKCFDLGVVRRMYVAAQVARMDLKVDSAVKETMRIYKHTIKSSTSVGFIPMASSSHRVAVAVAVCRAVVNSFSGPSVNAATVQQIVRNVIWDDMEHNFSTLLAEGIAVAGVLGTIIFFGMPLFLGSWATIIPLVVPNNIRLLLMLACDVTLILTRAFKECTRRCIGQPLKHDIEKAAHDYRSISRDVHDEIKLLVPLVNFVRSFQREKIEIGFRQILDKYLKRFNEGAGTGTHGKASDQDSMVSESSSMQSIKKLE